MANEVKYVSNVGALSGYDNTFSEVIIVEDNDRTSGNPFVWHAGGVTPNGGTIYAGASGGFWVMQTLDTVSVKWFDAKGDGSTDDTAAIQAALNVVNGTLFKVFFPAGVYIVSDTLIVNNNTTVYGQGTVSEYYTSPLHEASAIKIKDSVTAFSVFKNTGTFPPTNIVFDGIVIDGNRFETTEPADAKEDGCGIRMDNQFRSFSSCTIRNCFLVSFYGFGIGLSGNDFQAPGDRANNTIIIENCDTLWCGGIWLCRINGAVVRANNIRSELLVFPTILVEYCYYITIDSNIVASYLTAIQILSSVKISIINNTSTNGIVLSYDENVPVADPQLAQDNSIIISGNKCEGRGIEVNLAMPGLDPDSWKYFSINTIITNNLIRNIYTGVSCIWINKAANFICSNNIATGSYASAAIAILGSNGVVVGNLCYTNQTGIALLYDNSLVGHTGYKWGNIQVSANNLYDNTNNFQALYGNAAYELHGMI